MATPRMPGENCTYAECAIVHGFTESTRRRGQHRQLDIAPEQIGQNAPTEVALVGDGKAIVRQLNKALGGRERVHPKDTPWHAAIAEKSAANAAQSMPQLVDDAAPANYYRALRDVGAWAPEDAIIIGEGASTMDIGRTQLPNVKARHRLDAAWP